MPQNLSDEVYLRALLLKQYSAKRVDYLSQLFPKQRSFVVDPSTRKTALCTRRAGKSEAAGRILGIAAQAKPGEIALYISLTRDSAKRIMWPVLSRLNRENGLGWEMAESSLSIKTPEGSTILLVGADAINFMDRLRGAKYSVVVIDEGQSFGSHLQTLVEDVLEPACLDLQATIYILGTPGPIPNGFFYDATNGKHGYSVHKWSVLDNPFMPHAKGFIEQMLKARGWTTNNPTFRREWLGEWVIDLDALVYRFRRERNIYSEIPSGVTISRVLGIDYGWNDKTAFGIVSYSDELPDIWIEHSESHAEMIPSDIAIRIQRLVSLYHPSIIVADTGGLGKSITEEMIRRYGIPIKAAQKTEKMTNIHLMNGDFIDGHLKVHASLGELMGQYETLVKDDKGNEQAGLSNDECDCNLYAYREAKAYAHTRVIKKSPAELIAEEEDKMERELIEKHEQNKKEWWEL